MTGTAASKVRRSGPGARGENTSSSASRRPNVRSFCLSSSASGWSVGKPGGTRLSFSPEISPNVSTNRGSSISRRTRRRVVGDGGAERRELGRRRVPHPAADVDLAGRHVEVAARVAALAEAVRAVRAAALGPRERRGDVRLVRGLVLGEPDVAIDPERRSGRVGLERDPARRGTRRRARRHSASSGSLSSRSYSALRGVNQSRSLLLGEVGQELDGLGSEAGERLGRGRHRRGPRSCLRLRLTARQYTRRRQRPGSVERTGHRVTGPEPSVAVPRPCGPDDR